jgi:hypothetical protein
LYILLALEAIGLLTNKWNVMVVNFFFWTIYRYGSSQPYSWYSLLQFGTWWTGRNF